MIQRDRGLQVGLATIAEHGPGMMGGDSGFGSRNPDYAGHQVATIDYYLSNGQRDEYPAAWALRLDLVERALEYFRETGE